jgi:hypothetical protein
MSKGRGTRNEERGTGVEVRGSRFDALVDATVREMLDVEPRADLRARVLHAISSRDGVAFGFRRPAGAAASAFRRKILIGTAFAAAVVLFVAFWLPARKLPVVSVAAPKEAQVIRAPVAPPPPLRAAPTQDVMHVTTKPSRSIAPAIPPAGSVPRAGELPPLKQIAPIDMASLTTSSIAPKDISVEPLAPIAEVEIAPLNPPDRRD